LKIYFLFFLSGQSGLALWEFHPDPLYTVGENGEWKNSFEVVKQSIVFTCEFVTSVWANWRLCPSFVCCRRSYIAHFFVFFCFFEASPAVLPIAAAGPQNFNSFR
jgi:hypothetical protein